MRYAILKDDVVVNVILAEEDFAAEIGAVPIREEFGIGDRLTGEEWQRVDDIAPPATQEDYEAAIQSHVDATARKKLFRDGVTMASYVTSTNPQWGAEAGAFVAWRDLVWAYAYEAWALVQAGKRSQPSVVELLEELPAIEWP
jgi:hypothetical protein